jgi:hypothetical protein
MVPVISSNRFLWQTAANYWRSAYRMKSAREDLHTQKNGLGEYLHGRGLRNLNWINTFYLPLGEKEFILVQGQADLSGDYDFKELQPLSSLRYSGAVLWGHQ